MKKYLVTGAAGFIGSAVAQRLIDQGHEVYSIDNLSTGLIEAVPQGVQLIRGDCQDSSVIAQLNNIPFEAIYHAAGQSSGEVSFEDPVYDLQTNTQSTLLLLKLALNNKTNRFIYASTMSVYGDQQVLPVTENHVPAPKSFYGVGKLASENYLKIYKDFGLTCTALRLFNVYGPGQNLTNMKQGMVSIFLAQALSDGHIHVKGSKDRFRDFIYIDDIVNAFLLAGETTDNGFHLYNVASGLKMTVGTLVDAIRAQIPNTSVKYEGVTPGDQFGIFASTTKVYEELKWKAQTDFNIGSYQDDRLGKDMHQ